MPRLALPITLIFFQNADSATAVVLCIVIGGICAIVAAGILVFVMIIRRRGRPGSTE